MDSVYVVRAGTLQTAWAPLKGHIRYKQHPLQKTEIPGGPLELHSSWAPAPPAQSIPGLHARLCRSLDPLLAMHIDAAVNVLGWISFILLSTSGYPFRSSQQWPSRGYHPRYSVCPRHSLRVEGSNIFCHQYPICDILVFLPRVVEQENPIQQKEKDKNIIPRPLLHLHSHLAWFQISLLYL